MSEALYNTIEGPKGRVDVFEVTQEIERDALASAQGTSRPWDIRYEVRFGNERQSFWAEGEAMTVAKQLAGVPD